MDSSTENSVSRNKLIKKFESYSSSIRNLVSLIKVNETDHYKFDDLTATKTIKFLSKKLRKNQLSDLETSVVKEDGSTSCIVYHVPVDERTDFGGQMKNFPHFNFSKLWRYPDLLNHHQLRALSHCRYPFNKNKKMIDICINPYHYEKVPDLKELKIWIRKNCFTEPQNNDADMISLDDVCLEGVPNRTIHIDENSDRTNSDEINLDQQQMDGIEIITLPYKLPENWCTISYYEYNRRIGDQFETTKCSVIIDSFTSPNDEERFCIGKFNNVHRTPQVIKTRKSIGKGIRLYYIGGEIFLESMSDAAVFIQSPNTAHRYGWHPATVCKVPQYGNIKIFDMEEFAQFVSIAIKKGYEATYALTRMCSIRISFGTGWGTEYRCQTILMTPCWLEVHLNGPLQWIDNALSQLGEPPMRCSSFS